MKKQTVKYHKIPSVYKNIPLDSEVTIVPTVPAIEGACLVVKSLENEGKKDDLDFASGRLGKIVTGDVIPAVLGYRKATVEFAGYIPSKVTSGDTLYLLCESGVVGAVSGVYEKWGTPLPVKVLGGIVDYAGHFMNLKQFTLPAVTHNYSSIPFIGLIGTRMDCGKTTMACKITKQLVLAGKKAAAAKVTGVAFTQDLYQLKEHGANPVMDFVDMGLPSTCNGNSQEVIRSALRILEYLKQTKPDVIVLEFGDSLFGEYHVADVLVTPEVKDNMKLLVLAANDFAGIHGTIEKLSHIDMKIGLVTGPVVNSQVGVDLVQKYFGIPAESNLHFIPFTMDIVNKLC